MAKDEFDTQTLELPFSKTPIQALLNVIHERKYTAAQEAMFVQNVELRARSAGDLQMMMAVRDWKRRREVYPAGFPKLVVAPEMVRYKPHLHLRGLCEFRQSVR